MGNLMLEYHRGKIMEKMTKEEWHRRKARYAEYQKEVYSGYPEAEQFKKRKIKCLKVVILLGLFIVLANYAYGVITMEITGFMIVGGFLLALVGYSIPFIFFMASMSANWKISLILYLQAFRQFGSLMESVSQSPQIHSAGSFFSYHALMFQQMPFLTLLALLSWVHACLVLAAAIWLTVPSRNRELAEQTVVLEEQIKNFKPTDF